MKSHKTPLRYPGGKSRAVTKMDPYFPDLRNYDEFREPFLGGGSVAVHITKKYSNLKIWVNDLYEPLVNFWQQLQMFGHEMKGKLKMFNKNGSTGAVDLKNFRGETKVLEKTFDYMLLVDTGSMSIGITDWETVKKRVYFTPKSPVAKFKLLPGDFTILASNVKPAGKNITSAQILDNLLEIL